MHSRFVFQPPAASGYRLRRDSGGGIFLDSASYWLQALQETVGLPSTGGTGAARCAEPDGVDHAFDAELELVKDTLGALSCSFGPRHRTEHTYEFAEARVRVRGVLLPTAGAVPLNLAVRTSSGHTEVMRGKALSYYAQLVELRTDESRFGVPWAEAFLADYVRLIRVFAAE